MFRQDRGHGRYDPWQRFRIKIRNFLEKSVFGAKTFLELFLFTKVPNAGSTGNTDLKGREARQERASGGMEKGG